MHSIIFQYVHIYCVRWFALRFRELLLTSDTLRISNSFLGHISHRADERNRLSGCSLLPERILSQQNGLTDPNRLTLQNEGLISDSMGKT